MTHGTGSRLPHHIAVVETLTRLAAALDDKDWNAVDSMFAIGASAYGVHGRDAIVDHCRQHLGGCGPTHHSITNHIARIDGHTAEVTARVRAMHVGRGALAGTSWECFGTYQDQLALESGNWLIASRVMTVDFELGDRAVLGRAEMTLPNTADSAR